MIPSYSPVGPWSKYNHHHLEIKSMHRLILKDLGMDRKVQMCHPDQPYRDHQALRVSAPEGLYSFSGIIPSGYAIPKLGTSY